MTAIVIPFYETAKNLQKKFELFTVCGVYYSNKHFERMTYEK